MIENFDYKSPNILERLKTDCTGICKFCRNRLFCSKRKESISFEKSKYSNDFIDFLDSLKFNNKRDYSRKPFDNFTYISFSNQDYSINKENYLDSCSSENCSFNRKCFEMNKGCHYDYSGILERYNKNPKIKKSDYRNN